MIGSRVVVLGIVAQAVCFLSSWASLAPAESPRVLKAGAFAQDITPDLPISINGGMTDRTGTRINDRLHARCLVLDDGSTTVALVVCDSCMIPAEVMNAGKERASKATGIPASHMLVSATHTHSAPTLAAVFQSQPDERYRGRVIDGIAKAIEQAYRQREPAQVGWGVALEPDQVFNRRWFMKEGAIQADPFGRLVDKVKMNPSAGSADLVKPAGPTDPQVCVLAARTLDGRPIALLANYSLHYVGGVPGDAVSADYFGAFAEAIAQRLAAKETQPAFVGILSNGTSADVNNINFRLAPGEQKPFEQMRVVGQAVADAADQAYQEMTFRPSIDLAVAQRTLELGVRRPTDDEVRRAKEILDRAKSKKSLQTLEEIYANETVAVADYPATVQVPLKAMRIGDLGIASIPCEVFVDIGLAIKKESPLKPTFVIELANGYNGYLPTVEHHGLGGYETWRAKSSYLERDAAEKVQAAILELLGEVARPQR